MGSNIIQIESLSHMSFDDVLSLYRQGYKLEERSVITRSLDIKSLATCPGTVQTGNVLTLSAAASVGTAPYAYHWSILKPDGTTDTSLTATSQSYTFATDGSYTISVYVTDSCADGTGIKTSPIQTCTVVASTTGTVNNYGCVSGVCTAGAGTLPAGCGTGCGTIVDPCATCDHTVNYCIGGQCINKKYTLYGSAAVGVLVLILMMK